MCFDLSSSFEFHFSSENLTRNHRAQWIRLWRHQTTQRAGTLKFLARMSSILRITWKRIGIRGTARTSRSTLNRCTPWMNTVTSIQGRSKHSNMLYLIPSLPFVYSLVWFWVWRTRCVFKLSIRKRWNTIWNDGFVCLFGPKVMCFWKTVMRVVEILQNDKYLNTEQTMVWKWIRFNDWWFNTGREKDDIDLTEAFKKWDLNIEDPEILSLMG